jgi:hypothetical protein
VTQALSNIGSGGQPLRTVGEAPGGPSLRQRLRSWLQPWSAKPPETSQKEPQTRRFSLVLRELASDTGEILAIGAISHGAWLITPSAGWIVGGIGLGALAMAVSRDE